MRLLQPVKTWLAAMPKLMTNHHQAQRQWMTRVQNDPN
jgi:hypothetical protein